MLVAEQGIRAPLVPLWRMIRHLYPVYGTIAESFHLAAPPYDALSQMDLGDDDCLFRIAAWIEAVDASTQPYHLRSVLQELGIGSSDLCLQMWLKHFLSKPAKGPADRDKIDFLLAHYLRLNLPPSLQEGRISRDAISAVLEPVLGEDCDQRSGATNELNELIGIAERCRSLADMERSGIITRGRELKLGAADLYFTPPFLIAFTHFNAVVRRECQRLMNSDLKFIGEALERLEKQGITHVDCTAANWSDREPLADLKNRWATWELGNSDYSGDFFARLIGFRAAMEEAMARCVELSMSFLAQELRAIHDELTEMQTELSGLAFKLTAVAIGGRARAGTSATTCGEAGEGNVAAEQILTPKTVESFAPRNVIATVIDQARCDPQVAAKTTVSAELQTVTPADKMHPAAASSPPVAVTPKGPVLTPSQAEPKKTVENMSSAVGNDQTDLQESVETASPAVSSNEAKVDSQKNSSVPPGDTGGVVSTTGVPDLSEGIVRLQKILSGKRPSAVSIAVAGTRVLLTGAEVAMFSDHENATARTVQRAVGARIFLVSALEAYSKDRDKTKLAAVAAIARTEQESLRAVVAKCKASKLLREEEILAATGKQLSAMLERAERILK